MVTALIFTGVLCSNIYLETIAARLKVDIFLFKKAGHFTAFMLLTAVVASCQRFRMRTLALIAGLIFFAALTELMQMITIERSPSFFDWTVDLAGILTGIGLAAAVKAVFKRN